MKTSLQKATKSLVLQSFLNLVLYFVAVVVKFISVETGD